MAKFILARAMIWTLIFTACSEEPSPTIRVKSKAADVDQSKIPNMKDPGDRAQGIPSPLSCSISTNLKEVPFGSSVEIRITTSADADLIEIDGNRLASGIKSIRYTPRRGGANNISAKVFMNKESTACDLTINTTPPIKPRSAGCAPTYQARSLGNFGSWVGADVGHAFNLSDNRTLSLYGDTYLAQNGSLSRAGSQMIGNTIGISSCVNGVFTTTYHWWGFPPNADAFFRKTEGNFDRYWSTNLPWKVGNILYVPLNAIEKTDNSSMGFRSLRTDVAIITNPDALPNSWNMNYRTLFNISSYPSPTSQGSSNFWGGFYNVVFGDYVYFYNNSGNDVTMSRIGLDGLKADPMQPSKLLEYLSKDGKWKLGYLDSDAKRLGIAANTGLSIRYNFKMKKWLMIHFDTTAWISNSIFMRTADSLEGPWSEKRAIYNVPEVTQGRVEYDRRNFCYQAFEHLEFNSDADNQLAFTYSCNADDLTYVINNMNIYFPKFVRIPIP